MEKNITFEKIFKAFEKYKYIIVIVALGFILLILPQGEDRGTEGQTQTAFDVESFEKRIENSLSVCDGVGRCKVLLSIESGPESVYEKEARKSARENENGVMLESDSDVKPSVLSEGSGRESPLLVKEIYPSFRGAIVICDGAEKNGVKALVLNSVTALTGLSSDKISIVKMKN